LAFLTERRRKAIQIEDGTYVKPQKRILQMTDGQIYGSFSGLIFGVLSWLYLMCINAKDWTTMWLVLAGGILIFWISTKICLHTRQHYYRVAMGMCAAVGLVNLIVINLRWNKWIEYFIQTGRNLKYTHVSLSQLNFIVEIM